MRCICLLPLALLLASCGPKPQSQTQPPAEAAAAHDHHDHHDHHGHGHGCAVAHKPLNGGTIILLGDHYAELGINAETGVATFSVLDQHASTQIALEQQAVTLQGKRGFQEIELALRVDPASEGKVFTGQADSLKGVADFDATLLEIKVGGQTYAKTTFPYPKGNQPGCSH